jgi:hypothetical protein
MASGVKRAGKSFSRHENPLALQGLFEDLVLRLGNEKLEFALHSGGALSLFDVSVMPGSVLRNVVFGIEELNSGTSNHGQSDTGTD